MFSLMHVGKNKMLVRMVVAILVVGGPQLRVMSAAAEDMQRTGVAATGAVPPPTGPVDLTRWTMELNTRRALAEQRADKQTVQRLTRALSWVDVLSAPTAAERHSRVQMLEAAKKPRPAHFPPLAAAPLPTSTAPESASGPSADICGYDGEPGPCLTLEETEDYMTLLLDIEWELQIAYDDALAADAEVDQYCTQNPWDCEDGVSSGPSAFEGSDFAPCRGETIGAIGGVLSGIALWAGTWTVFSGSAGAITAAGVAGAATAGLAAGAAVTVVAGVAAGALVAVGAVVMAYDCLRARVRVPTTAPYLFEPEDFLEPEY